MLDAIWSILLQLAPWLLVGAAVAAAIHVLLPVGFIHRQLRGPWGVVKAVLVGVPMPLCSCGVIPAGLGLKKDGASDGASVGFLISTPQTGVDSILVSASFLGWPFALFKVGAAAVTGMVGGWLTDAVGGKDESGAVAPDTTGTARRTWRDGFDHGLMLVRSIWGWLVFGILVSAAIEVWLPPGALADVARLGSFGAGLMALGVSLPLYVCATASVPIAASLVAGGLPTGAALVFLMAGPATNVATVGAVYRGFGWRTTGVYLGTIIVGSLGLGVLFDRWLGVGEAVAAAEHVHSAWWEVASAILLLGMLAIFALEDARRFLERRRSARGDAASAVPTVELGVEGMVCGGCVEKLEGELRNLDGVGRVEVSLEPGRARVGGDVSPAAVEAAVERAGFRPAPPA